jgi:hypothetical protein
MNRRPFGHAAYTDLEKLRIEYFIHNTNMTAAEMATALGNRTTWGVQQYLWRQGISLREERGRSREDAWAGV